MTTINVSEHIQSEDLFYNILETEEAIYNLKCCYGDTIGSSDQDNVNQIGDEIRKHEAILAKLLGLLVTDLPLYPSEGR